MRAHAGIALFFAGMFVVRATAAGAVSPPWETCSIAERKSDVCGRGDAPRAFEQFLQPRELLQPNDAFSAELRYDLGQSPNFTVSWKELGRWGTHRIRKVTYSGSSTPFATLLVVEGSPKLFSPVMKWSGQMPEPEFHDYGHARVLVVAKDFGGNIPMVSTWAWIWSTRGPVRLDVDAAVAEAIEKAAPGYGGYGTGIEWPSLHCQTWVWKGDWPGKIGVDASVEAWFELGLDRLRVRRAFFLRESDEERKLVAWPSAARRLIAEPRPPTSRINQLALRLKGLHGTPISTLRVRAGRTGPPAAADARGFVTLPLSSPVLEGTPVPLEVVDSASPLVVISPCRGVVTAGRATRDIVLAQPGHPDLLKNAAALESLAECILRAGPIQERYEYSAYARHRQEALVSVAASIRVNPAELDTRIQAIARTAATPLRRGILALYRHRPLEAERHLRRASPNESARANAYLGRALFAQRRLAEAVEVLQSAIATSPFDPAALTVLGFALGESGDFPSAEIVLRSALSAEESASGPEGAAIPARLHHLAYALYARQDYRAIEQGYRRALAIVAKTHGTDSARYAEFLSHQASLAAEESDHATAESLFRRALAIQRALLGSAHSETADSMLSLGAARYHRQICEESDALFEGALAIRRRVFGDRHPATAGAWNAVGFCYDEKRQSDIAAEYYRRALSIQLSILGEDHTDTVSYMSNLGKALAEPEAEQFLTRALTMRQVLLGPDHPELIEDTYNLSLHYANNYKLAESERLLRRALAARERLSGPDHHNVAYLLTNLSALLINQGKLSDAEPLLRRALPIQEKTRGLNHRETAQTLGNIGIILDRQGHPKEAEPYFDRALRIYNEVLGPEHPDTRNLRELRPKPSQ
ncbi:MAG: tetratricopeptide repeat protein [Bryobacterales bacterium]|nr:tetratricopeptide repeat protein [Bryobacterales bacterium]